MSSSSLSCSAVVSSSFMSPSLHLHLITLSLLFARSVVVIYTSSSGDVVIFDYFFPSQRVEKRIEPRSEPCGTSFEGFLTSNRTKDTRCVLKPFFCPFPSSLSQRKYCSCRRYLITAAHKFPDCLAGVRSPIIFMIISLHVRSCAGCNLKFGRLVCHGDYECVSGRRLKLEINKGDASCSNIFWNHLQ